MLVPAPEVEPSTIDANRKLGFHEADFDIG